MTEERIQELAQRYTQKIVQQERYQQITITDLIRIVAAEAREGDWKAERDEYIGRDLAQRQDITELVASEQTLKGEREKLIGVLGWIKSQPQECQRIMAKHGWKYEDGEDFEQKMTFTMYSHVVECAAKAEAVLAEVKGEKSDK